MGVQRHLKVLGIFARLYHRDGKEGYLKDLPLVMKYLRSACERYIDLKPLLRLLDELEVHKPESGIHILNSTRPLAALSPSSPAYGRGGKRVRP